MGASFSHYGLVFRKNQTMANIIDFRFKVKNEKDDKIFKIKIAWQTSVKDAIPTIKKEMATQNKQVPDDIKLYVDDIVAVEILELRHYGITAYTVK